MSLNLCVAAEQKKAQGPPYLLRSDPDQRVVVVLCAGRPASRGGVPPPPRPLRQELPAAGVQRRERAPRESGVLEGWRVGLGRERRSGARRKIGGGGHRRDRRRVVDAYGWEDCAGSC